MSHLKTRRIKLNFIDIISEEINAKIPARTKKFLKSTENRESMKQEIGDHAFLDSENKKFPVYNPSTGKIDCKLIYAAYLRSRIWASKGGSGVNSADYYKKINAKAKSMYASNKCEGKIGATLTENDYIDLVSFTEIFTNECEYENSKNMFFEFLE